MKIVAFALPGITFSRFSAWLSNSSGAPSWLSTTSFTFTFAGMRISAGVNRWSRIVSANSGSFAPWAAGAASRATGSANQAIGYRRKGIGVLRVFVNANDNRSHWNCASIVDIDRNGADVRSSAAAENAYRCEAPVHRRALRRSRAWGRSLRRCDQCARPRRVLQHMRAGLRRVARCGIRMCVEAALRSMREWRAQPPHITIAIVGDSVNLTHHFLIAMPEIGRAHV